VTPSAFIPPCEPTQRNRLPKGDGWLYEVMCDGCRLQVHKADDKITLFSREGHDWTDRFPRIAAALTGLRCSSAIIDTELAHDHTFADLHGGVQKLEEQELVLWAFDLLFLDDEDLRAAPLTQRKRRLRQLVERAAIATLTYAEHVRDGERLLAQCERLGLAGVVAKRAISVYRSGPSTAWVTVKCLGWPARAYQVLTGLR